MTLNDNPSIRIIKRWSFVSYKEYQTIKTFNNPGKYELEKYDGKTGIKLLNLLKLMQNMVELKLVTENLDFMASKTLNLLSF